VVVDVTVVVDEEEEVDEQGGTRSGLKQAARE
jgi:hypothetical protein